MYDLIRIIYLFEPMMTSHETAFVLLNTTSVLPEKLMGVILANLTRSLKIFASSGTQSEFRESSEHLSGTDYDTNIKTLIV